MANEFLTKAKKLARVSSPGKIAKKIDEVEADIVNEGNKLTIQDEGTPTSTNTTQMNFVGTAVTVTQDGASNKSKVTINAIAAQWNTSIITTSGGTASNLEDLLIDTSTIPIAINLPAGPTIGDRVLVTDAIKNASGNNITVSRNGSNIDGTASNFTLNLDGQSVEFTYMNTARGWIATDHTTSGGGGVSDHGVLTGLADDDHNQYLTEARHDSLAADNPHSVTFTQAVTADGSTDVSAAEMETLTDGSNADALHSHSGGGGNNLTDTRTTDLTITDSDNIRTVRFTSVTGLRTVTLPLSANNSNREITVKRSDRDISPTDYLRVSPSGSDEIDGYTGASYGLFGKNDQITLRADGVDQWLIVNESDVVGLMSSSGNLSRRIGDQVDMYVMSTGASDRTFTLLPAVDEIKEFTIKKSDVGVGKITIVTNGSETIDGAADFEITRQYDAVTLKSDSNNWHVTSRHRHLISVWETDEKSGSYTLLANEEIISTHTSTGVVYTLPGSPSEGDRCRIGDASTAGASQQSLTISGNGNTINGSSNYILSNDGEVVEFLYVNATIQWRAVSERDTHWSTKIVTSNNFTAKNKDEAFIDTTTSITHKLPSSPSLGHRVRIADFKDNASSSNITVDRNGKNINGAAANYTINTDGQVVEFVYTDATEGWRAIVS